MIAVLVSGSAVLVNACGAQVIHTTTTTTTSSSYLFYDPYLHQWRAAKLKKGKRLQTADGVTAVADGGTTPKQHDGWMWDLTVPGNNDHDFYVTASAVTYGALVHDSSCSLSEIEGTLDGLSYDGKTVGQLVQRNAGGSVFSVGNPIISGNSDVADEIQSFLTSLGLSRA